MAKTDSPLVSIITITFNSERFVEDTIKSVVNQDYPNIEYIIIDGGSKDDTLKIIERYRDKLAEVVSEPDQGISDAMNKGIRLSSGDIVGIIHSDDYYADNSVIRRVVEAFGESPDIKLLYGVQDLIDAETGAVRLRWGRKTEPSEIKKRMYLPHPTVFCRREVYEKAGLFRTDYRHSMDYEWALRALRFTNPHFLDYRIACMRDMGNSRINYRGALAETARALKEHGHYADYLLTLGRNFVKIALIGAGMEGLVNRLWARNISPEKNQGKK